MLEIKYHYNKDFGWQDVSFEGLSGLEPVSNVKEALNCMCIRNPVIELAKGLKKGEYNELTDEEYRNMLEIMKCISGIWHYENETASHRNGEYDINPLTLLANALELICEQAIELRGYQSEPDANDRILKEVLIAQKDETAEELRRGVLERALKYTEYRFRWELYSSEEKAKESGARRMAHAVFMDSVNSYVRYLKSLGNTQLEELGDDRQKNGDLACRIVQEIGIGNR